AGVVVGERLVEQRATVGIQALAGDAVGRDRTALGVVAGHALVDDVEHTLAGLEVAAAERAAAVELGAVEILLDALALHTLAVLLADLAGRAAASGRERVLLALADVADALHAAVVEVVALDVA